VNLTLKRVLIFFSVSLNIGFIVYSAYGYLEGSKSRFKTHDMIGYEILGHTHIEAGVKEKALTAIDDFNNSLLLLNKKIIASKLELLALYAEPEKPFNEGIEGKREKYMNLLSRQNVLIHEHFLQMRKILGFDGSREFFSELHEHMDRHLNRHKN
jgi:hypothetical protein